MITSFPLGMRDRFSVGCGWDKNKMSVKITKVTLYRTRLTNNNVVLDRSAHAEMLATCDKIEVENCTFQRDTRIFRAPLSMDVAGRYNYIQYNNESQDFFGFITQMTYVNDNMTAVYWEPDYWSTWQGFLYTNRPCFVERQIVSKEEDKIGQWTQDEPIGISDYEIDSDNNVVGKLFGNDDMWYIVAMYGKDLADEVDGNMYGKYYWSYNMYVSYADEYGAQRVNDFITNITRKNCENMPIVYMAPHEFLPTGIIGEKIDFELDAPSPHDVTMHIKHPDIKNGKCLTYPYCRVTLVSSDGCSLTMKPEDVYRYSSKVDDALEISFIYYESIVPSPEMLVYPDVYENESNHTYKQMAIKVSNFPQCCFAGSDYLTIQQLATDTGNAIISSIVGKPAMTVRTGVGLMNDIVSAFTPTQISGDTSASSIAMQTGTQGWYAVFEYPREDQLKALDDYFSRYGYTINQIIDIDYHKRSKWDYIKTKDCQFPVEYAPVEAEEAIDKMFDDGLTIWHEYSTFGDYSQDNS